MVRLADPEGELCGPEFSGVGFGAQYLTFNPKG